MPSIDPMAALTSARRMAHGEQLARAARKSPAHVAFRFEGLERTFAELDERVTRLARALAARGVGRGDRVAVLMTNRLEVVESYLAGCRLGAMVVPVNFRLVADEVVYIARDSGSKVLLVDTCDRELVVSAFRSGARGIFPVTDANLRLLCKCLHRVAAGQIWANTEQLNYLMDLISEVPSLRVLNSVGRSLLTPREEQVVALVAEGLGNRQIARELNLSEHTIKKYLFRVFEKLGVSTRVELVLYAVNNGDPRHAE